MNKIKKQFGQRMQSLRKAKKLTQEDLAEIADCHPNHIGSIERAESAATLDTIGKIATGLNVEVHELFLFEKTQTSATEKNHIIEDIICYLLPENKKHIEKIRTIVKTLRT